LELSLAELRPIAYEAVELLGHIALTVGRNVEAVRLLAVAATERDRLGIVAVPHEQDRLDDVRTRLREVLGERFASTWEQGAALSWIEAIAYLRRARGQRRRPAAGWESLTPTETRVAELVAQGLTNPQIGDRLFITRGTVKTHLAHIFAKLDITSRAELAAKAIRHAQE
jgi:DNA-binding CsgD family transcriptional regulator